MYLPTPLQAKWLGGWKEAKGSKFLFYKFNQRKQRESVKIKELSALNVRNRKERLTSLLTLSMDAGRTAVSRSRGGFLVLTKCHWCLVLAPTQRGVGYRLGSRISQPSWKRPVLALCPVKVVLLVLTPVCSEALETLPFSSTR